MRAIRRKMNVAIAQGVHGLRIDEFDFDFQAMCLEAPEPERCERRKVGDRDQIRNAELYRGVHRGLYGRGFSVLPHSFSREVHEGVEGFAYC